MSEFEDRRELSTNATVRQFVALAAITGLALVVAGIATHWQQLSREQPGVELGQEAERDSSMMHVSAPAKATGSDAAASDRVAPRFRILRGHRQPVGTVTFGATGQCLLSADTGDRIQAWDFYAGTPLATIDAAGMGLRRAILTPDGKQVLACGNDATIRMWSVATGKFVRDYREHTAAVSAIRWIPGSRRFVSSGFDSTLVIWNADTGEVERRFGRAANADDAAPRTLDDLAGLDGHFTWIRDIALLPEANRLISAGNDAVLFVWDIRTGMLVNRLVGHRTVIMGLAVSPDGRFAASVGSDNEIMVWDIEARRSIQRWTDPGNKPPAVAFAMDRGLLATGGADGVVRLIDVQSGHERQRIGVAETAVTSLAFSRDLELVCGGNDGLVRIGAVKIDPSSP